MRKALPAVLLAACSSLKPPNATEPLDARERAVTPSDRQLGSRTLPGWPQSSNDRELLDLLVQKHGEAQRPRIERGLKQVAAMWRPQDGDDRARRYLVEQWFESDPRKLAVLLGRFEYALEQVDGYFLDMGRELRRFSELELGPELPIDEQLAALDLSAHVSEDLFQSKLAFIALLDFPLPTLDEMLAQGAKWSREEWAAVRLTRRFALRPSAEAAQARSRASADAEAYIAGYNLWMHHALTGDGRRLYPKGVRLISHWNLRDQIKAEYGEPDEALALSRQRLIRAVMEQIVSQTIPRAVIDDPRLDWYVDTGRVTAAPAAEIETEQMARQGKRPAQAVAARDREEDKRYAVLLETFRAARRTDQDSPLAPTEIDRRFQFDREIPEAKVQELLESMVRSPLVPRIAALIRKRLGRALEPHDVWYSGFLPRAKYPEAELSRSTRSKYPTAAAYKKDIPRLLEGLGFTPERARFFDSHIVVDPARGAGHALQSARRGDDPHLRTRVNPDGMDYKGYNIAIHEMGHNVEQICSLYEVDHTLLQGVPNTAFTEALAFTFQNRDLELLGLSKPDPASERLRVLNDFWATWEIAGAALVDMAVWRWMYAHPDAGPQQLREATLQIARDLWDKSYAPVLGGKGTPLLGIYSHMISSFLYLPDYPIGHLIAFQLEEKLRGPRFGAEFERAASFGRVTPDLWMQHAAGAPVSAEPLLRATELALRAEGG
ncbi:MAG TPA: hypothetical protein VE964_00830 [Myxococcales bacterium]|nr:hypothetical protein [Myxococcales bacterium]